LSNSVSEIKHFLCYISKFYTEYLFLPTFRVISYHWQYEDTKISYLLQLEARSTYISLSFRDGFLSGGYVLGSLFPKLLTR